MRALRWHSAFFFNFRFLPQRLQPSGWRRSKIIERPQSDQLGLRSAWDHWIRKTTHWRRFDVYRIKQATYELSESDALNMRKGIDPRCRKRAACRGRITGVSQHIFSKCLGETGLSPGLILCGLIIMCGSWRMEVCDENYTKSKRKAQQWVSPLAIALQHSHIIFL